RANAHGGAARAPRRGPDAARAALSRSITAGCARGLAPGPRPPALASRSAHAPRVGAHGVPLGERSLPARRHGARMGGPRPLAPPADRGGTRGDGVIHAYGSPDPPAPRLLEALATRGYAVSAREAADERATVGQGGAVPRRDSTLVLSSGGAPDLAALGVLLGAWREAREAGPPPSGEHGAWEPPLRELEEHRLAESDAWLEHFSMRVRPIEEQVLQWAA